MFPFPPPTAGGRRPATDFRAAVARTCAIPLAALLFAAGAPAVAQMPPQAPAPAVSPAPPSTALPAPAAGGAVSGSGSTLGGMGVRGGPGAASAADMGTGLTGGGLGLGGSGLSPHPRVNTRIAQPPGIGSIGSGRAVDSGGRLTSPLAP